MQSMKGKPMSRFLAVALLCATLGACAAPTTSGSAAMATDTKDIKTAVATFCMGRFVIDLPNGSAIIGGNYKYNFARIEKPRAVSKEGFDADVKALEDKRRSIKHEKDPNLIRAINRPDNNSLVMAYWEKEYSKYGIEIEGHKWSGGSHFLFKDQVDPNKQDFGLQRITKTVSGLRARPDTEIPTEPGYCFGGGFIANAEWENEEALTEIGIAGHPDAYVTIWLYPLASRKRDKPLLDRMGSAAAQLGSLVSGIRLLRKGDREIASFKGQEYLVAGPNSGGQRGHLFLWETQGEGTLQEPFVKIELQTGHQDPKGNPQQTKLTDEQALALWDRIVTSFRLRPVSDAPSKKTSDAGPPQAPLGAQAPTGRLCPQTGLWECDEAASGTVQGGGAQYIRAGERMPHVVVAAAPSMWQRLKGQNPAQRIATMWTLVDYDELAAPAVPETAAPEPEQPAGDKPDQQPKD
jgi:Tle cognate immunity protein 4 C-terminal domain/Tle cognate immunity protein 4 N-terminal domain